MTAGTTGHRRHGSRSLERCQQIVLVHVRTCTLDAARVAVSFTSTARSHSVVTSACTTPSRRAGVVTGTRRRVKNWVLTAASDDAPTLISTVLPCLNSRLRRLSRASTRRPLEAASTAKRGARASTSAVGRALPADCAATDETETGSASVKGHRDPTERLNVLHGWDAASNSVRRAAACSANSLSENSSRSRAK